MNRRQFGAGVVGASGALLLGRTARAAEPEKDRRVPFATGREIEIDVASPAVTWRGDDFHLVRLSRITFTRGEEGSLRASIRAAVVTFDDVTYDVCGAVFDEAGRLLGTGRTECAVSRIWLGRVATMSQDLTLDFGVSLDYAAAATFELAVSNRKVRTPDEWRDGK